MVKHRTVRKETVRKRGKRHEKGKRYNRGAIKTHKKKKIIHPEDGVYSIIDFLSN